MKVRFDYKEFVFFIDTSVNIVSAFKTDPYTYVGSTEYIDVLHDIASAQSIAYLMSKLPDPILNNAISPKWLFTKYNRKFPQRRSVNNPDEFFDLVNNYLTSYNIDGMKMLLYTELNPDLLHRAYMLASLFTKRSDANEKDIEVANQTVSIINHLMDAISKLEEF